MDQRKNDEHTPLNTAALNPAYIPGLMPSPAAPAAEAVPVEPEPEVVVEAAADEPGPAPADAEAADAAEPAAERPALEGGPTFEAADRRGSITADHKGIRLRLDGEEADFAWEELSAVEYATSRWAKRFTITVHLPRPRWFRTDVQAQDRAGLDQWSEQLEEVLNAYFEEE
ncbi:hypothetical protein ACFWXK_23715 [Streptomyces sp. NPDC059070]|uniref:hypothetical protein n=1 Tax=Streptomyces sp. NPDC059070 TaxID=3346713 RepID=UPI00369AA066